MHLKFFSQLPDNAYASHSNCPLQFTSGTIYKMVAGSRGQPRFPPNPNYYFLAHLQFSLKFACKFIPWYLH